MSKSVSGTRYSLTDGWMGGWLTTNMYAEVNCSMYEKERVDRLRGTCQLTTQTLTDCLTDRLELEL